MQNDFDRFYRGLNFIIAGLIISIVDFKIGSFDILPDTLGAGLILFALWKFSKVKINQAYQSAINLAMGAALLELLSGVINYFVVTDSAIFLLIMSGVQLIVIYGLIMFARAMQIYASENDLGLSLAKWRNLEKLYFWMYFIPFGVLSFTVSVLNMLSILETTSLSLGFMFAPIFLLIILLLLWPLIQTIRVSISMKREMLN